MVKIDSTRNVFATKNWQKCVCGRGPAEGAYDVPPEGYSEREGHILTCSMLSASLFSAPSVPRQAAPLLYVGAYDNLICCDELCQIGVRSFELPDSQRTPLGRRGNVKWNTVIGLPEHSQNLWQVDCRWVPSERHWKAAGWPHPAPEAAGTLCTVQTSNYRVTIYMHV